MYYIHVDIYVLHNLFLHDYLKIIKFPRHSSLQVIHKEVGSDFSSYRKSLNPFGSRRTGIFPKYPILKEKSIV